MKRNFCWNVLGVVVLIANLLPTPVSAAPSSANNSAPAEARDLSAVLPAWFATGSLTNPDHVVASNTVLPGWFTDLNEPLASPPASPDLQPLQVALPNSVLSVNVFGPLVASLGSPPGAGEVYTAVIRNSSAVSTAYNISLIATHQTYFIHDGGDQLVTSIATTTASIPFSLTTDSTTITWTPQITVDLIPGQVLTLNFKLQAACDAQSGQQMRVGIYYNADPAQPSTEFNSGGLNITTGRGNLVLKKEPGIQSLSSSDYGRPITWTVTAQNTGLGILYGAMVTDTGGISLSQPGGDLVPSVFITSMQINETRAFTVVGTVEACNLTNVARASWTCGNLANDATAANPISSTTSMLFSPEIPRINLQVSSPITFSYCGPLTRTVMVTVANSGGPAGNFRLDSNLESNVFLRIITSSMNSDWQYDPVSGTFAYLGGSPTGTIPGPTTSPVTLTFQVRPAPDVCSAGSGDVIFEPLFNDVCNGAPFAASQATLRYDYAQGEAPTLGLTKSGPALIHSGDVFYYQVTVTGENGINISGTVNVMDVLPPEFVLTGLISASAGISSTSGQTLSWSFSPPPSYGLFSATLTYQARDVLTKAQCGASSIIRNNVQARATPTCPGCSTLVDSDWVDTAIANNEGIYASRGSSASTEACSVGGLTFYNQYVITGATVITWTGAVFTDAMGVGVISPPLVYRPGSLSVTVGITDYAVFLTPTIVNGRLVIDLSPLQDTGVPTQNVTLHITYTVDFTDALLAPGNRVQFWAWSQLYLPNVSTVNACAADNSYNDATYVTLTRGDLNVSLEPAILNRCHTNTVTIHVDHPADADPNDITNHIVVTFTGSVAEVRSARSFRYGGSLSSVGTINYVTDTTIGGGRGIITFTLPVTADINSDGTILFDIDVDCTDTSIWNAGLTFQSLCGVTYHKAASPDHVYLASDLILFATPIEYTVRQREVVWKFFVANNGNLAADSVVVTNTLNGISITSYARSSGTAGVTPVGATAFNITNLSPNDAVEVTVTGTVFSCNLPSVDIIAHLDCLGAICRQLQRHISFNTPPPYLLTNNGQTADLPMCDVGFIVFRTKNASPDVSLYQLDITETLSGLEPAAGATFTVTIVDRNGALVTSTTAFTPALAHPTLTDTLLIWKAISAPMGIFDALDPLAVVVITVPVKTSCVPPNSPQSHASASAQGPCGKQLDYTENAVTLQSAKPHMSIEKLGRGPTGGFGKYVAANPGDQIVWQLRVENQNIDHPYVAYNVTLSDTWPANFNFITATSDYTPTIMTSTRTITWNLGTVEPGIPLYFYITGTLTGAACQVQTQNASRLSFGCADGCGSSIVPVDYAYVDSNPDLRVSLAPGPLQTCGGDIPVTIRNYGSTAYTTTLTVTLPSGYVYSETVSSGLTPTQIFSTPGSSPQFRWDTIPGRPNPALDSFYEFTLTLRVRNSASSGACPVSNDQPVRADLEYDNDATCMPISGPFTRTASANLTVLSPTLEIVKAPSAQTGGVSQRITWTIALTNVGAGIAPNLVVTDVVGSNYDPASILASNGSDGAVYTIAGNVVTWTIASFPVSGTWSVTVSAALVNTGDNRNVVTASSSCATGCQAATTSDTAYTTLVQEFSKNPTIQTSTIGSLAVFTFSVSLPDQNALYTGLALTDTLPAGLGYVSSTVEYSYNTGASGNVISDTPTIAPGWLASGNMAWQFGDLPGAVQINGVITTVIQNIPANYDGVRLTNVMTMTYTDNGLPFVYTDTARVDVQEPVLHIGKSYVTPYGCGATLLQDNFNNPTGSSPPPGWTAITGTWNIAALGGSAQRTSGAITEAVLVRTSFSASDLSYSAMLFSTDASSSYGLVFRYSDAANYYRLRLRDNDGGTDVILQEVAGGAVITLATSTALQPTVNTWYHVEVRMEGNRIQAFVNGLTLIDVVDTTPRAAGSVGLYANNCGDNQCRFDDVLVTHFGQTGCFVGANDLVTYTLTISNQSPIPGYDLVITDAVPTDMSLVTYTLASGDPASVVTAQPAPIPGATGALTWGVNQLTSTVPYSPLVHNALTLTIVLRVSPGITANVVLSNQASLGYSSQPGSGPVGVEQTYSGGSHSTAVRTMDSGLSKTVTSSEWPTATLGSLVTYTLIVPSPAISATLYNVAITDTVHPSMTLVTVTTTGGTGGSSGWSGQVVTAAFTSIPSYTQAYVTITARISSALGAYAGYLITNTALMTHPTAPQITTTIPVTTLVGEPFLSLVKASAPPTSNTVGANNNVTYTVTITNWNSVNASPAYDVVLTDTLPPGMRQFTPFTVSVTLNGSPVASGYVTGYDPTTGIFTIAFGSVFSIPVNGTLVIAYVARVDVSVGVGLDLLNQAQVGWSSLPGATPGDRDYGPLTGTTNIHTVRPSLIKTVTPVTATLGSLITYTILLPQPPITATVYNAVVTDVLDNRLSILTATLSGGVAPLITTTTRAVTATFDSIPAGTQAFITITAVLSSPLAVAGDTITNVATLSHSTGITQSNRPVFTVTEPSLTLVKASNPPTSSTVGAGDRISYTVSITNRTGITTSAAYDVAFTDTLPVGLRNAPPQIITITLNGGPVSSGNYTTSYNSATGILTVTFGPDFAIPVGGVLAIQYVATVDSDVPAAINLINLAQVTWSSLGGAVPGDRNYGPISSTTNLHSPLVTTLGKALTPLSVTIGSQVVFTVSVPGTPIGAVLSNVVVTDVVDGRLQIVEVSPPATFSGQLVTATFATIPTYTQQLVVVTTTVHDLLTVTNGTLITNVAAMNYSNNPTGAIWSPVVTTTVREPIVTLNKFVQTPRDPDGAGDVVTYTLALANTGTWPAFDVIITDALPSGIEVLAPQAITVTDPTTATTGGSYPVWTVSQLNVGGGIYITFTARVTYSIGAGLVLTNSAWGWYDTQPGDNPGQRGYPILTSTVPITTGWPALDLTKSAAPSPVQAGDYLTYTLTVTNNGIVSATGVVISDVVPVNTNFVAATMPYTGPDASRVISWPLGTLDIGVPRAIIMVVSVISPLLNGTLITNTAWVTTTEGVTRTDTITTPVVSTHTLAIVKTATPSPVQAGELLTYTLAWSVSGNEPALDLTISDTAPANAIFITGTTPITVSGNLLTWLLGNHVPGDSGTVTVTVQVTQPLVSGTLIYNAAIITDSSGITRTSDVTTPVISGHTLDVFKSALPAVVRPGDWLTYTIAYTITGNEPVLGVTLSDTIPAHTTFVTATLPHTLSGDLVLWPVGDYLPAASGITQATGVVTLVVQADTPLTNGLSIVNTVLITDTGAPTDTHTVTTPVTSQHVISLSKSAAPDPVLAGDLLTYTLSYTITGDGIAPDVTLSDTTPQSTTFWSATPPTATAPAQGDPGLVVWQLGSISPPATRMVTMVVRVNSPLISGTQIYNAAIITDSSGITRTSDVTTPVVSTHTLDVFKSATPAVVRPGDWLTYTIAYTITGNEPVLGVTLSDTIPAHTTFVTATLPHTLSGDLVLWPVGDYLPAASGITQATGVVTLVVQADTPLTNGLSIVNTVLITDTGAPTDTHTVTTPVTSQHVISLSKNASPDLVTAGDLLTYTLSYTITGDGIAPDVTLSDTTPQSTTFWSATPPTATAPAQGDPGLVVWQLGSISPPATRMVTMVVRVNSPLISGTQIYNAAVITDSSGITRTSNVTTPVVSTHTLGIVKTVSPSPVAAGGQLLYTLAWSVTGSEPAFDVTISDTVPANTTFITGTTPITVNGSLLTWPLGNHVPGDSGMVTFTVQVVQPLVSGTLILNSVIITDSSGITRTDTVTTPVQSAHTIAIIKTATPSPVAAGGVLVYTLVWSVSGNEPALDLTISDTVPANTIFITGTTPILVSGNLLTWLLSNHVPGDTGTVTFTVQVAQPLVSGTLIYNAAILTDSSGITRTSDVTTPVVSTHTLSIVKTAAPSPATAGGSLLYTLAWSVGGNEPAFDVTINDTVPAHTSFVTGTTPIVVNGNLLTWPLGNHVPGNSGMVTFTVQVAQPLVSGTLILNSVIITDSGGITHTDTVTTPVQSAHAIAITKTASPSLVAAGGALVYTLVWSVSGNEPALDLTISDTVPANTSFVTGTTPITVSGDLLTWSLGDHVPGDTGTVTFTVQVTQPLVSGTLIYNAAILTDSSGITRTSDVTTPVISGHTLDVFKSALPAVVRPGDWLTYTIAYTITGNEPVLGVTLSDTIPAHTTFVTATLPHTLSGDLVLWPVGDYLPAASGITQATGVVTLVVQADTPLTNGLSIVNTVLITDTGAPTDTHTVTTPVTSQHVISLSKSAAPDPVLAGDLLTYTLSYTITGDGIAPDVTLSDTTPQSTTFWSATPPTATAPAQGDPGLVVWQLGSISPPATRMVTMVVRVNSPLISGTQIYNVAVITDSSGITRTSDVTTPVVSTHTLGIVKTATPSPATAGGSLLYTLAWSVGGNEPAFDVTINDTVPAHTSFVTGTTPIVVNGNLLTWPLGNHVPGNSGMVTFTVQVAQPLVSGTLILNSVIITDSSGITRTDTVTTPVVTTHTISVAKSAFPSPVQVGGWLTYTIAWSVAGNELAPDVTLSDAVPQNTTYQNCYGGLTCTQSGGLVIWGLGTLTPPTSGVVTLVVQVDSPLARGTLLTNTVTITDSSGLTDTHSITTPVLTPGLVIAKSVTPDQAAPHQPFTYTIRITNTGQITFDPLVLTDTLPPNFYFIVSTGSPTDPNTIAEPLLRWDNLGPLTPGADITVSFAITAARGITGTFVNVALVEGVTPHGSFTDTDDVPIVLRDPAVAIQKQLVAADLDSVAPNFVTFTIAITNVGPTAIAVLPLLDQYDPYYLSFAWAAPMPDEPENDGLVSWYDLTAPAPHGFGRDLPPGEAFHLTTVFTVAHDITTTTFNTAVISRAVDTFDNPTNRPTDTVPITSTIPTAVELLYFRVDGVTGQQVCLAWATAVEIDNYGFNLYRADANDPARARLIHFEPSALRGPRPGATYVYVDTVPSDGVWWYWLADVDTRGNEMRRAQATASVGVNLALPYKVYLPILMKGP